MSPGPWELDDEFRIYSADSREIGKANNESDAFAMMAVPQLYAALEGVVDWVEANVAYGLPDELLKRACDALRQAKR
jgi:hypothetical protein